MNIEALEYFIKVAEYLSISKVSQQFHISQPALSQMMQKLEDTVGHELLLRSNKGIQLTPMGKIFLEYAYTITKTYSKMKDELNGMENNLYNVVINSTWSISQYALPCLLIEIKKLNSQYSFDIRSNRSEDIIKNVKNGISDIGIIYGYPDSNDLISYPFGEDEIVLVSRADYKISNKITIEQLLKYNLINFEHGCYYTDVKHQIAKLLENSNEQVYKFKTLLNLDSISAVKSSVSEGHGLSFLPLSSVKKEIQNGEFKLIKIDNINLTLKVNIISLNRDKLRKQVNDLIDIILKLGPRSLC